MTIQFTKSIECKFCRKVIFFDHESRKFYNSPHFEKESLHVDSQQTTMLDLDKKLDRIIDMLTQIHEKIRYIS